MIEIKTGHREWDNFWPIVKGFIESNRVEIEKDGKMVHGYHSPDCPWLWFRDCIHYMEITPYLDPHIKSTVDLMLATQQEDGSYFDFIRQDGSMLRVPTEADLEYLAVIGVYRAWLATGDSKWMRSCLPKLEKGLEYMTSHPWRWDEEHQLPKRAYTIDTWDFDIRDDLTEIHWPGKIDEKTHFGIMHGDVSGLFYAYQLMALMLMSIDEVNRSTEYMHTSKKLQYYANSLLWNGKFYTHRYPLDKFKVSGVNEKKQLSLSNPYNINRHLPDDHMAKSIIKEYMQRRKKTAAFAEWFSIDPPFPAGVFGSDKLKPGVYVNGGIMPLVGGQLAKAAFHHGFQEYGVDILRRYFKMIDETGESYLWYFPDGRPATKEESTSPEAYATDPWGSSSMMSAVVEGLAGITVMMPDFGAVMLEPGWDSAGVDNAEVKVSYEASRKLFHYTYTRDSEKNTIEISIKSHPHMMINIAVPWNAKSVHVESRGKFEIAEITELTYGKSGITLYDVKKNTRIIIR